MTAVGVIPARFGASRFPGKPLATIAGEPMIQRVWQGVMTSQRLRTAIVATDDEGNIILVEQYRPPVDGRVIELPAGIAGDLAGSEDESWSQAAQRELMEETGYEAERLVEVLHAVTSAGLTNESVRFLLAERVRKVSEGGGDASEEIVVHCVPLTKVNDWLTQQQQHGVMVDARVFTGLYLLNSKGDV